MNKRALILWAIFALVILIPLLIYLAPDVAQFFYSIIAFFAPIWLPALLAWIAWPLWLRFARSRYWSRIPYAILELKPGPETPPSAAAMEIVLNSLYYRTEITKVDFLLGRMREFFSFELYAHAGGVRFFARVPERLKDNFASRLQAEYHDIEVHEVPDYSREIAFDPGKLRVVMQEYTLARPDSYPLKTFTAYESEPDRHDPLADLVESLAGIGENEHVLLSFIVRPHQRDRQNLRDDPTDSLHEDAHREIAKLTGPRGDVNALPPETRMLIRAMEAALAKPSFDCGVRALYIAGKEHFDESYGTKLAHLLDPFGDPGLNSFAVYHPHEKKGFFLSELFESSPLFASEHLMNLYRRRAFFAPPYYGEAFVLNTEELATVYHLPHARRGSALAQMRGLSLEPPENLPV